MHTTDLAMNPFHIQAGTLTWLYRAVSKELEVFYCKPSIPGPQYPPTLTSLGEVCLPWVKKNRWVHTGHTLPEQDVHPQPPRPTPFLSFRGKSQCAEGK